MADVRVRGKTVGEIVDAAMGEMQDRYGSLGRVGLRAGENMRAWLQEIDRADLSFIAVLGRCELLVRQLLYDTVVREASEDNERCMDYVMERISDARGRGSAEDRAYDLAKEYFDQF